MRSILIRHASIAIVIMFSATTAHAGAKDKLLSFMLGASAKKALSEAQVQKGLNLIVAVSEEDKQARITQESTMTNLRVGNGRQLIHTFHIHKTNYYVQDLATAGGHQGYAKFIQKSISSNICRLNGPTADDTHQWYRRNNVTLIYEYFTPEKTHLTTVTVNPKTDC